jgi:hypothetical protein
MPMVVESTFELEFAHIAAVITDVFIMLFRCCISVIESVQYNVLHKYFFDLTTLGDLKMTFYG